MTYKQQLQEKFPKLSFEKFIVRLSAEKSIIVCPDHGQFVNSYKELIRQKYGCKKCKPRVEQLLTANCEKHGRYEYKRYNSKNCVVCRNNNKKDTHIDFLRKLGDTHLTFLSEYERSDLKMLVKNKYGELLITPNHLLSGKKPDIKSAINKTEYCINKFKEVHKDYYDYSEVKYVDSLTKVTIICPVHGKYKVSPISHNSGRECKKCAYEKLDIGFSLKDFIRIAGGRLCTLYLVEITAQQESFIKIGITCRDLKTRLSGHNYKAISLIKDVDAGYIFEKEKKLHNKLKQFSYTPTLRFNGFRECYDINHLKEVLDEFRTIQKIAI
jgi:hypothetical protein